MTFGDLFDRADGSGVDEEDISRALAARRAERDDGTGRSDGTERDGDE
ncbi:MULTISPECIES: hypothetical protein [Haloferacaceae]|uniref:Uncharacterized protein n=1 Tax=Halorubrum glutamatedens TaxID=2707018 RepID=A0ABD5QMF1_9EURY|nr:hypothetical protein [Halobellus captivus]